MVKKICFLFFIFIYSCVTIYKSEDEQLISKDRIGIFNSTFLTSGYYYRLDKFKEHNTIEYFIFDQDGYFINKRTPINLMNPSVKYDSLHNYIKKIVLKPEPFIIKRDVSFINKNAQVWDTGVFRIEKNKIHIQQFINKVGNYKLSDYFGVVENDSLLKIVSKKKPTDKLLYKFMSTRVGKLNTYMKDNQNKFWKD